MKPHAGPRIDRIPAAGAAGLLFTIATLLILLIGIPELRVFLAFAVVGGLFMAALIRIWRSS